MVIIGAGSRWVETAGNSAERRCVVSRAATLISELWILGVFLCRKFPSSSRLWGRRDRPQRACGFIPPGGAGSKAPRHDWSQKSVLANHITSSDRRGAGGTRNLAMLLANALDPELSSRRETMWKVRTNAAPATARKGRYKSAFCDVSLVV